MLPICGAEGVLLRNGMELRRRWLVSNRCSFPQNLLSRGLYCRNRLHTLAGLQGAPVGICDGFQENAVSPALAADSVAVVHKGLCSSRATQSLDFASCAWRRAMWLPTEPVGKPRWLSAHGKS